MEGIVMKFLLPKLSLIALVFLLSACGGGGIDGGGTTNPPPPANLAPTANAGTDTTADEEATVSITGSATDTDGTIASYAWSQTSGEAVSLTGTDAPTASFISPTTTTQLSLTFQLTVTDDDGATASDSVDITINSVNLIPVASAGNDQTVNEQTNVILSGNSTDTDGTIASYSWIQTAGITVSINNESSAESSFTAPVTSTPIDLTFQLTVTDNEEATASDSVVITVEPIVDVTIEQSTVDIATVSSGAFGEVEVVDGIAIIDITTVTDEGLVTANDPDDNIIWMGYINVGDETITLNADTTTMALMLLVPNLVIFNNSQPDIFLGYYESSQSVADLSTYLTNNNDWYQLPQAFTDLYSAAVLSLFNQINPTGTQLTAKVSGSTKSQKAVIVVNENEQGVITTNYAQTLNGIEVKVENITTAGKENLFSIEVTNKLNRWVGIAVGPDPESYSGSPASLPSGNFSYIHKGKNDTARFEDKLDKLDDDPETKTYGLYVYGPAADDFFGNYVDGRFANKLHGNATAYTLLFDIAVPVFGRAIGGKSCLQQMFDPTRQTYGIAAKIISDPNIQDYLSIPELDNAALEIGKLIADAIATTGSDCLKEIALKQLQKLIPLIGQVQTITDLFANINTANDVYQAIAVSKGKTSWEVSNRINMSFYMQGVGYIPSPDALYGKPAYRDKTQIPSNYIANYPGTCIADATKQNICEGYTFAKDTPKIITYTLKCIDPVTEATTPCKSGVVEPDMIDLIPQTDGTFSFNIDYSDKGDKEYSHIFKVYDETGAENQYTASVQIQTAVPQLVYRIDGQEFETVLDASGFLQNVTPYEINTQGAASKTVTFEIHNKGLGVTEINQIGPIIGSSRFTASNYSTDFTNSPITKGQSRVFDLTYTPTGFETEVATLPLFGVGNLLGDENLLTSSIGFKQYERMDLMVEGNSNAPEIKVVLNNAEVPSSSTLVAEDFETIKAYSKQPVSITISNVGSALLRIASVRGPYPNTTLDLNNGVDIEPGGSITVNGTYFGNTIGSVDEIITIVSNDADEGTYQLLLRSNVTLPDPPRWRMSPSYCVGGGFYSVFYYEIRSSAGGSMNTNVGGGDAWAYNTSEFYSEDVVACWSHTFPSYSGGTIDITLTDEFGQVVKETGFYIDCPAENDPPAFSLFCE
jgi:hypothetical protein